MRKFGNLLNAIDKHRAQLTKKLKEAIKNENKLEQADLTIRIEGLDEQISHLIVDVHDYCIN